MTLIARPDAQRRPFKVKNRDELIAIGDRAGRELVLDIVEDALAEVDGYDRVRSILSLDGDILRVGNRTWDLSTKRHVFLIGAGKACNAMAMAVDHVLGDRLTHGIAIVKIAEESDRFSRRTEVHVGGHPVPNRAGHLAALRVLELVDGMGPDDLVIAVMSGGSSALMNAPVEGITPEEEAVASEILLTSGAGIYEINAVRRHISQINGGRLAERIDAVGAELIGINIRDAVSAAPAADISEPDPTFEGTPIGADSTTILDALAMIRNHALADRLPVSIVRYLEGESATETPKSFPKNTYYTVNSLPDLAAAAAEASQHRGLDTHVLTTFLEGESRDAGTFFASLAREIQATGRPFSAPCVLISAGETTTRIEPDVRVTGHGGPSQELALSFALAAHAAPGACMYSMDSEGTDGTSGAAGGITDSTSLARAREHGIDVHAHLRGHASNEALATIGDVVVTGNTGTNLCDLNILFVPAKGES